MYLHDLVLVHTALWAPLILLEAGESRVWYRSSSNLFQRAKLDRQTIPGNGLLSQSQCF